MSATFDGELSPSVGQMRRSVGSVKRWASSRTESQTKRTRTLRSDATTSSSAPSVRTGVTVKCSVGDKTLSKMAEGWVAKEMSWYCWDGKVAVGRLVTTPFGTGCVEATHLDETKSCKIKLDFGYLFCPKQNLNLGSSSGYQPIDNGGKSQVSLDQLENAVTEYSIRFAFCTADEDASWHRFSGSPYLLVATNVKETWTVPEQFEHVKFMLVSIGETETCALFITCMPGVVHGTIDGQFSIELGTFLTTNGLQHVVKQCHSGGGTYQPDIRIYPTNPDPTGPDHDNDYNRPFSRLVIEFEFGNRNASKLRETGYEALNNGYSTLFLGIKVWKKTFAGVFGAAAVLWEKDQATGNIALREAFDFGTKQLSQQSRDAWNSAAVNALPNRLPPVPAAGWTRPVPINSCTAPFVFGQPTAVDPSWELVLPKDLILHRTPSDSVGGLFIPAHPTGVTLPDFRFDLKSYQRDINEILD